MRDSPEDFYDPIPTIEQGRFPYFIEGKITNISDDEGLGRVKAKLRAMDDGQETDWLSPAWPGSIEAIPSVGEQVWVQFIEGDPAHGIYFWFPTKNTQNRPSEAMVLGTMFIGLYNHMVTLVNDIKAKYNAHTQTGTITGTANLMTGAVTGTCTVTAPGSTVAIVDAPKAKAADGSVVPDKSTSEIVLSGKAKVR